MEKERCSLACLLACLLAWYSASIEVAEHNTVVSKHSTSEEKQCAWDGVPVS